LFATQKNKPLITDNIPNPCVKILTVKPEWSKAQSWDDFVKGYTK
jgi:hypothetical protein